MKYLLLLVLIASPLSVSALDTSAFDFVNGQPGIQDDTSVTCNNQATIVYDFVNGQPGQQYDTSATCNTTPSTSTLVPDIIWFD